MPALRAFRLVPVPMRLGDSRWKNSSRQRPCLVHHFSETQARAAAAQHFSTVGRASVSFPWNDPDLVACFDEGEVPNPSTSGVITVDPEPEKNQSSRIYVIGAVITAVSVALLVAVAFLHELF